MDGGGSNDTMTPANWTLAEWLLVAGTIGGAVGWLVKIHFDKRKADVEAHNTESQSDKTEAETLAILRTQIRDMAATLKDLRERVEALEEALLQKENELRRVRRENEDFKLAVRGWVKAVMQFFKEHNITGYPEPDPKLLDTDPNMKAVK